MIFLSVNPILKFKVCHLVLFWKDSYKKQFFTLINWILFKLCYCSILSNDCLRGVLSIWSWIQIHIDLVISINSKENSCILIFVLWHSNSVNASIYLISWPFHLVKLEGFWRGLSNEMCWGTISAHSMIVQRAVRIKQVTHLIKWTWALIFFWILLTFRRSIF
jgi:hypothetical protein